MFKVFGKKDKRIAELEKENKKLQEEKDGALMLYNTTIKNHEQLVHKYRSLKAGSEGLKSLMEGKNKKVRELEDKVRLLELDIKDSEMMIKDREEKIDVANKKIRKLYDRIEKLEKDYEKVHNAFEDRDSLAYAYNEEALRYRKKLEKYESVMAHATCSSMNDFRLLRGKVYNSSKQNKRIRNKCIMKLADQMEKIFKEMLG